MVKIPWMVNGMKIKQKMLIGFIQTACKSVIPRSGATWESAGTASVIATFYQEIATPERARNDKFGDLLR